MSKNWLYTAGTCFPPVAAFTPAPVRLKTSLTSRPGVLRCLRSSWVKTPLRPVPSWATDPALVA